MDFDLEFDFYGNGVGIDEYCNRDTGTRPSCSSPISCVKNADATRGFRGSWKCAVLDFDMDKG